MSWGKDIPLKKLIGETLPDNIPVIVDNWLRFHAYAEMKTREDRKVRNFCLLGVEPNGLAGAMMLDGRIQRGVAGLAGEIGHMAIAPEMDEVCACGGRRCFEVAVSPMRMEKRVRRERRNRPESLLGPEKSPRDPGFRAILSAADRGDAFAREFVDEAIGYFATALNCIVQIGDPGLVIIQGEYASAGDYFISALKERLQGQSLVSMRKKIEVEYSVLGANGFLFGASLFMSDDLFRRIGEWATDGIRSRLR
jgi:predicted NBD/HSP70 family sugar kinase